MPGGPLTPISIWPDVNGRIYPNVHVGGANSRRVAGMQVQANLGADSVVDLLFPPIPGALPSGVAKLSVLGISVAQSGSAQFNPAWASMPPGTNYDTAGLMAEGVQTITWMSGDNDELKETKINLTTGTPTAGQYIFMRATFETASWTLAFVSTWQFFIIWE